MVRYCSVRGCGSKQSPAIPKIQSVGLSFHHIPKNTFLAQKWLFAMDNPIYPKDTKPDLYQHVLICSKHFTLYDFHDPDPTSPRSRVRRKLKTGMILHSMIPYALDCQLVSLSCKN